MTGKKHKYLCTILCSLLVALLINDVNAKSYKSSHTSSRGSHSYPTSHGLSGSHSSGGNKIHSSHTYPSHSSSFGSGHSGGTVTQHRVPSSHTYPSNTLSGGSGGSSAHAYPPSNSMSGGYGTSSGHYSNSMSGGHGTSSAHGYPSSNTLSGAGSKPASAGYPASHGGLFGGTSYPNGGIRYPSGGSNYPNSGSNYPHHTNPNINVHHSNNGWGTKPVYHHTSSHSVVHHHHYSYRPPSVIYYHSSSGLVNYPVYTGTLPPYVYEYRSSENKYRYLLAGLALYNLGKLSSNPGMNTYHKHYIPRPDERCTFGVLYPNGQTEEMAVDCRAITSFIYSEVQAQPQLQTQQVTTNVVTNVVQQNQVMLPNGTLINVNNMQQPGIGVAVPNTQQILSGNGMVVPNTQQVNTVTTTTTQVTSVTDPRFNGGPVQVNQGMNCYVSRTALNSYPIKKPVPCDLLQTYAAQSLHGSADKVKLSSLAVLMIVVAFVMY